MRQYFDTQRRPWLIYVGFALIGLSLAVLPFALAQVGTTWVRITNYAILYVLLALGLNIVVGFAGLLDLGYIAFYAVGAYVYALLASPQFGLHLPFWVILPIGAAVAALFGVMLGAPTLKLRGDYLAIVTLGFGEIIRIFLNNLSRPVNITSGPQGIAGIDPFALGGFRFDTPIKYYYVLLGAPTLKLRGDYLAIVTLGFGEIIRVFLNNLDAPVNITNGPKGITGIDEISMFCDHAAEGGGPFCFDFGKTHTLLGLEIPKVTNYYFLFLILVVIAIVVCYRLERSRIGRAWMAIREDEIAAKAMGINTRNLKLLAFGMGATFGGVSGVMFASFQGFISPESFSLQESIIIVAMVVIGGIGHLPGVIIGALLLAALPEVLRYVAGDLQSLTDGRLDASILRQLLVALAMIGIMLARPRGLWPSPEHGKLAPSPALKPTVSSDPGVPQRVDVVTDTVTNPARDSGTRHG